MDTYIINGVCRCCASQGSSKDIDASYTWMGGEEIYSKMLRDCFDIALSRSISGHDGGICELCITQLRNAYNFKKQVVSTEDMLKKRINSDQFKPSLVKVELEQQEGTSESDNDMGDHMDQDSGDDQSTKEFFVPIKSEVQEAPEVKPKRRATKASTSAAKKPKLEAETSKSPTRTDDLTCQICDREYSKLFNLKRHLKLNHGQDTDLSRKSLCDSCGNTFLNRESLARHLAKGCPNGKARVCIKCNVDFATKSDMCRHMNTLHWSAVKLRCPLCRDQFEDHESHDSHLYSEHQIALDFNEKFFDSLEDLTKWQRNIENKDGVHFLKRCSQNGAWDYHCAPIDMLSGHRSDKLKTCPARIEVAENGGAYVVVYQTKHVCIKNSERKRSRMFCPLCSTGIEKFGHLCAHLSAKHGIEIEDRKLSFDTYDAFLTWKKDVERNGQLYKRTSTVTSKNGLKVQKCYYFCAKYGPFRRPKSSHTESITCPARVLLTKKENSELYEVMYQNVHLGHDPKKEKRRLTYDERKLLADRIRSGDSLADIMNQGDIGFGVSGERLNRNVLYNVIRDFKIDRRLVKNYGRRTKQK